MNSLSRPNSRPRIVTAVCIIAFVGIIAAVPLIVSDEASNIGLWYPPLLAFSTCVGLTCFIGLWMMKRWSVVAYTSFTVVIQTVMMIAGISTFASLVFPAIVIWIGFSKYDSMD